MSEKRTGCQAPNCDRPHWARGLCSLHYNRWYRGEKFAAVLSQQQAPPLVVPSSEADLAYLAGLLEGQRNISLKSYGQYWRMKVHKTDKEIIDWLATIGGISYLQSQGANKKDVWEWLLAGQEDIRDLLSAVLPYLKAHTKRDEATEVIASISKRGAPLRRGARPNDRTP